MRRRDRSVTEVTLYFLERIRSQDRSLNAFITVCDEQAIERARELDTWSDEERLRAPLFGVPYSLKDDIDTAGIRTTYGSKIFADHIPQNDALAARRLQGAGGVLLGKTNVPEFSLNWRAGNEIVDESVNPWDPARTSGGSSGGSAAAVAAGFGPISVGGDRGGSIRIPAAFCGVVGLVPSHGRVPQPMEGRSLFFTSTGPIARDVRDAAALLRVLAIPSADDPLNWDEEPPDYPTMLDDARDFTLGWWWGEDGFTASTDPAVVEAVVSAVKVLADAGILVEEVTDSLPVEEFRDAFLTISRADRFGSPKRHLYEGSAPDPRLSALSRRTFEETQRISVPQLIDALRQRDGLIRRLRSVFSRVDVVCTPTVGIIAPRIDTPLADDIPVGLNGLTYFVNLSGCTAISVPCGWVDGLPVGLQFIAPAGKELTILRMAHLFETLQPWRGKQPVE